ncbi:MAG: hypothetical protein D6B26_01120 [Spirochaetaceae bacterium]|nr:MAG: hypothetical protein D6B26_01120 [Spirochaetaceae bacterium]
MAKVSAEAKKEFFEVIKKHKQQIEQIEQREKNLQKVLGSDQSGAQYKRITLAEERLNLASYYLLLNQISLEMLKIKNESYLNDARKSCYQSIIYLEDVVSDWVDAPFSDYLELQEKIDGFEDSSRYDLVVKLGLAIDSVREDFGENSKWKWSFVELDGRFAAIAKNLLNFRTLVSGMDPRVDGYEVRMRHLRIAKEKLVHAADRYREKYELSTNRIDDFKLAIQYLSALRRLHMQIGETDDAEKVKKKIDVWKNKMESDEKAAESRR